MKLTKLLRRFASDRSGNLVIMFAFMLLPLIGLMGLAIDYSLALKAKTALNASTDAAVLAAATEAMEIIQTQSTANYDATSTAIQYGYVAGQNVFSANSAMLKTVNTPTLTLNLQRNGQVITATGSYTAQSPTVFGKMFGTTQLIASGSAVSSLTLPKYMNIYIATDVSQSMGIASTQAYMNQLSALTGGCVFGCHVLQNGQSTTNEQVAHNNNIQLRIDVIKQSIQNIISSAQTMSNGTPTISIGLYALQYDVSTLSNLSTSYSSLLSTASAIDLGPNNSSGVGDSNFTMSLNDFATSVSASGDGSSANSPQTFVFLMTDGVYDVTGNCTDTHCTKAFDPALCSAFKSKGATLGVIYTTYIPFPNEQTYVDLVQPFQSQISPNLQSCASSGYFYEASDGPSIQAAANALFAQAVSSGKLTQ